MATKSDRVVTVDEVWAAWHWSENPGNPERIYAFGRAHGVEPDAVDVFGRPAYSPAAIAKWARKREEAARKRDAQRAEEERHRQESAAWQARRAAAVREAQEAALRKLDRNANFADFVTGPALLSPADWAKVRAAGRHAGEQFERANPRPRLNGNPSVPLAYVDESQEGSLIARAVGAVKGVRVTDADRDPSDEALSGVV